MKRFALIMVVLLGAAPLLAQNSGQSLARLIETGNRKAALERIKAGADVNEAQPDGSRPINWAIHHVDYELIEALLARKASVNVKNEFGATPIAQAAELGEARIVKALLAAGAEVEGANPDGQTALMLAIKTGETAAVEALIKAGANVNTIEKFRNQTPLMWAAAAPKNAGAIVKMLLAKGADVKPRAMSIDWPSQITAEPRAQYRPVGGLTALLYAARNGCYDCVDALTAAGAGINVPTPEGVTALMLAVDNDHYNVAKLLLDRGGNPGLWDWWGRTALYIAIDRRALPIEEARRDPVKVKQLDGENSAAYKLALRPAGSIEIIRALLAADVDHSPQLNIHRPSRSGNNGRFVDPLLNTGCTPLLRATMGEDPDVVRALLAKGASPNINGMGLNAFLVAAGVGAGSIGGTGLAQERSVGGPVDLALMDMFLKQGGDVNAQVTGTKTYSMRVARAPSANEGRTALHIAVESGRLDVVRYLLSKGADPEIKDAAGRKAIDLAPASGQGQNAPATPGPAARANAAEIRSLLEKSSRK